jgi:hypothetical protein
MPRELLQALAADVTRLLAAGCLVAAGDEGLQRRAQALHRLAAQVPALTPVADAVSRVCQALHGEVVSPLLDLLVLTGRVRAGFADAGEAGKLARVPRRGPWETGLTSDAVSCLVKALTLANQPDRLDTVRKAVEDGLTFDLRLVEPAFAALDDPYAELADLVAEGLLPMFGRAVLPDLRARLDQRSAERCLDGYGRSPHGRRLAAICRIDTVLGAEICYEALRRGSAAVRPHALESLPLVAPREEVERTALAILTQEDADDLLRGAAVGALDAIRAKRGEGGWCRRRPVRRSVPWMRFGRRESA